MPLRILIATDTEHSEWVASVIRARTHEVCMASTPSEAWRLLRGRAPDLVLVGQHFPDRRSFVEAMQRRKAGIPLAGLNREPALAENLYLEHLSPEEGRHKLEALLQRHEERKNMVNQSVELASHAVETRAVSKELRRVNSRLTTLLATSRRMFALENEERILTELLRATAHFSGKAPTVVLIGRRQGLAVRVGLQLEPHQVEGVTIPVQDSAWKRTPAFQRLADLEADEQLLDLLGVPDYCALPLRAGAKTYGLLIVGREAEDIDRAALHTVAIHAATALQTRRRERELRVIAERDGLTRLPNYTALQRILRLELKRHSRTGLPLTLAMLDIDFFKQINDTHGHLTGDKTLRSLAELLQRHLRETDTVVRYGGEEFVMVMPATSREGAEQKVTELLNTIRNIRLPRTGPLTLSAGLASFPDDGNTPHSLLEAADHALYAAKREGRDRAITYTEWLESTLTAENELSSDLNGESPGDHP